MPEFDVIGGISTGVLIATYVVARTAERYADIEDFYRNTSTDWVAFRGIGGLLPNSTAVLDNSNIRGVVDEALDDRLLAEIGEAEQDDRQLFVGTTNLDYGTLQYWDLGHEAAAGPGARERIVDILMAATGIPGLFPPVLIDGNLHADGGAVQGIPAIDVEAIPLVAERWRARHGDRPPPPVRAW